MSEYPDQDKADVTVPTLAEMERCATILPTFTEVVKASCVDALLNVQMPRYALGVVPTSPHNARLASLEAEVARLLAANAVLQRGMQIIAAADVPEPAKSGIPARALGCHAQRIGLLTGVW